MKNPIKSISDYELITVMIIMRQLLCQKVANGIFFNFEDHRLHPEFRSTKHPMYNIIMY